jgi:uncharacterized protein involved in propanediol utilization
LIADTPSTELSAPATPLSWNAPRAVLLSPEWAALSLIPAQTEPRHFLGQASCSPHFGELLQGAFETVKNGRPGIERALVSTHIPFVSGSHATFVLDLESSDIRVSPPTYKKCAGGVRRTLDSLGLPDAGGHLVVTTLVPEGAGMGSSTADVVASVRAVATAVGNMRGRPVYLPPDDLARIAVATEHASDSIMFDCTDKTVLFEHRTGNVRRVMGRLPRMLIVGFNTSTKGIPTDALKRARYTPEQIRAFDVALALLERAISEQSVDLVGRVATFSAETNQNNLRKPHFNKTIRIKADVGAAGVVVAHSGTVAGFIFDPALPDCNERVAEARSRIERLGFGLFPLFFTPI